MHFSVHGDFFTSHIRSLALEPNITFSWHTLKETFPHLEEHILKGVFLEILEGKKEFIGINDFEYVDSKNSNIVNQIKSHIKNAHSYEELNTFSKFYYIPYQEKQEFFLERSAKKEEDFANVEYAWITQGGKLLEVEWQGHIRYGDFIRDNKLVPDKYPIGEYKWIKITTGDSIFCLNKNPTKEQLNTLKKYLLANKDVYFKTDTRIELIGYGFATIEGPNLNAIVITDLWKDDLIPYSAPTDKVKRISLNRAKDLIGRDLPIFIYQDGNYKRIPSLNFFYTKNKDLYCHLSDLYSY